MLLKRFTSYLLQHRLQALVLTFFITFVPILGILGILFAGLVTLVKGIFEGAIFTIAATLPYIISFFITGTQEATPLVIWAAVGVAVFSNILTWAFAVMWRKHTSFSLILQIAALLGVLIISVIHLAYPGVVEWWGNQLQTYYAQAQAMATGLLKNPNAMGISNETQLETINITKHYATGLMVTAVLFNALLQLIVARWWQASVFSPKSLAKELHAIRLSHLAGVLFIVSVALSYLGNSVISDIMPILYMLFGMAGLSLIHYLFGLLKSATAWFWLSVVYLTLIFALPTSMVFVSIIALFDVWLDIRKRFKKFNQKF